MVVADDDDKTAVEEEETIVDDSGERSMVSVLSVVLSPRHQECVLIEPYARLSTIMIESVFFVRTGRYEPCPNCICIVVAVDHELLMPLTIINADASFSQEAVVLSREDRRSKL